MMGRHTATRRKTCGEAGFSLIELLVSLTLLAMILTLLPGAFRTGKRGWETTGELEQRAAADASIDFLRHRLAETLPLFDRDESGRARLAFSGTSQDVTFIAPSPSGPVGGGIYRFGLGISPAGTSASALVVRMIPFRHQDTVPASPAAGHVLVPDIAALRLRYFGEQAEGEGAGWSGEWRRPDRLPDLIELQGDPLERGGLGLGPVRVELRLRSAAHP